MSYLNENSAIKELQKMSISMSADFYEEKGAAKLEVDNEHGKGVIYTYTIYPDLSVRIYNIEFGRDFAFSKNDTLDNSLCLMYCLNGYFYHKFGAKDEFLKIEKNKNIIIKSSSDRRNFVTLPKGVHLQISTIFITEEASKEDLNVFDGYFFNTFSGLPAYLKLDIPFRYVGDVDLDINQYIEILLRNNRTDIIGRLMTKSAIFSIIAIQLQRFTDSEGKTLIKKKNISSQELNIILEVVNRVKKNLDENITINYLEQETGLNRKKLQRGFKYLFGKNINEYVRELKLEMARKLIETTQQSISEISYKIGYSSRSYLSKAFYKKYNILPNDYKKIIDKNSEAVFEISYKSNASSIISKKDIDDIIIVSRKNNTSIEVTGCLFYHDDGFFQILEGSMKNVLSTFEKLKKDPRHHNVQIIYKGWKKRRYFSDWAMALLLEDNSAIPENTDKFQNTFSEKLIFSKAEKIPVGSKKYWERVRNFLSASELGK